MNSYVWVLEKCAAYWKQATEMTNKAPHHLGYMLGGDWSIAEESNGEFSATHLKGKVLESPNLTHLKEMVMRHSGYRRNDQGLWQKIKII